MADPAGLLKRISVAIGARDWAAAEALLLDLREADPDWAAHVVRLLAAAMAEAAGTAADDEADGPDC